MVRELVLLLSIICSAVLWGFLVTTNGWDGVMSQPFIVDEQIDQQNTRLFHWFLPNTDLRGKSLTLKIEVTSEKEGQGGNNKLCRLTYRWPENPDVEFDKASSDLRKKTGMPYVGKGETLKWQSMFYAEGLVEQLQIVRAGFQAQWLRQALPPKSDSGTDTNKVTTQVDTGTECINREYWFALSKSEPEAFQRQVDQIGDAAAAVFAEAVRKRFDEITRQAGSAFLIWVIAIPLSLVIGALFALTIIASLRSRS